MSNPIDGFVICPKCDRQWEKISEQGVSVQWHDECVICKFTPQGKGSNDGTKEELVELEEIEQSLKDKLKGMK